MTTCEERQRSLMCVIFLGFLFSICFSGQMAVAQNNTKSVKPADGEGQDQLKNYGVPLAVAIIAAVAAHGISFRQNGMAIIFIN